MSERRDVLGGPLSEPETALLDAYGQLLALLERGDLPPCAETGVREAVACLWQSVNDLALTDDRPEL